ncbi:hypothetical protein AJ87_07430 [Rhizobium yanglingense]|nr:hypothetical protein AJ87_07430 [Rhizobium yanglingense]
MSEFGGKTILLSHHQLFSAYSRIGPESAGGKRKALNPNLLRAFSEIAAKGKIAAWFWGHEHSLSIYEPFAGLERGRCIGHGAIPISTVDEIYKEVDGLDETPKLVSDTRLGSSGNIWNHGYAVLSLKGPECVAEYYELTAKGERRIYKEQF